MLVRKKITIESSILVQPPFYSNPDKYILFKTVQSRLQNSRVFFLKIGEEIGKAWRKSLTRAKGRVRREKNVFLASLPSLALCFQPRSRPFV